MKPISVMIVEDSRVVREFLEHIIEQDPRLHVVAAVGSGEEALQRIRSVAPAVISLDIRLPGMNGLELTQRIMSEVPTPIVVVSSDVENEELKISMNALRAGALAVVQKPVGLSHADYEQMAHSLCTKLAIMSQVRVIQQRYGLRRDALPQRPVVPPAGRAGMKSWPHYVGTPRVLGLVASTGGPNALVRVLSDLGADFQAPILLVQHITPGFVHGFVSWLNDMVPLRVVEALSDQLLEPGTVYVAPAHRHLTLASRHRLQLSEAPPVAMQRPSGTLLFRSMAQHFRAEAAGALLTGMGEDGAAGLQDLKAAGSFCVAEDESTAVVYGMPAAAVRLGAVHEVLPLPEIGHRLREVFARSFSQPR